ncbi:MAG: hypothetical protein K2N22_04395 [Clostridia bacterium]|nr:hypothetical protein [Clostridia bacterium]
MKTEIEVYIDGVRYRNCAVYPFNSEDVLDATLDSAMIQLNRVRQEIFEVLTEVTVVVKTHAGGGTQEASTDWIVSHDDSYESPVGSGLYNHSLSLVELTKYGEGFISDSICTTHPGGNIYTDNAKPVTPEEI